MSTHEHRAGEFASTRKPRQTLQKSADVVAKAKLVRAQQSLDKAKRSAASARSAKTSIEREAHAREAQRHAENASRHASEITHRAHAEAAARVRTQADKLRVDHATVAEKSRASADQERAKTIKDRDKRPPPTKTAADGGAISRVDHVVGPFAMPEKRSGTDAQRRAHVAKAQEHLASAEKSMRAHREATSHVDRLRHAAAALSQAKLASESARAGEHGALQERAARVRTIARGTLAASDTAESRRVADSASKSHASYLEAKKSAASATDDVERRLHERAARTHWAEARRGAISLIERFTKTGEGLSHIDAMEKIASLVRKTGGRKRKSSG